MAQNTAESRAGNGIFEEHGDRPSPVFIPGAQQDLITLTLDPVAGTAPSQFEVFHTYTDFLRVVHAQMQNFPPIVAPLFNLCVRKLLAKDSEKLASKSSESPFGRAVVHRFIASSP